jgi:MFS family permease
VRSGRTLGRQFGWLWTAYGISTLGTYLAFDAFPLIAIRVLHAGPIAVSLLASVGLAVGALAAVPLGPWMEWRRKRPVMILMDLLRFAALMTVPVAYAFGALRFGQLLIVAMIVAAADIAFKTASGAYLKMLVHRDDLLVANGRFESTLWTATALGPPLGGAAIGIFGPVTTVIANAVSFLLSACGLRAIGAGEARPVRTEPIQRFRVRDLLDGWRYILGSPTLRPLFFNTVLVNGLIMASAPLLAVLMLGRLGFSPWQYGLAFAVPCLGGLVGSRLSRRVVTRYGRHRVLLISGALRACWPIWLALLCRGVPGLLLVMGVEFALILCIGIFNPVYATYRLEQTPPERVARTLTAWTVSSTATTAALIAAWGLLAGLTSPRIAIAIAGLLLLFTPLLLPRQDRNLQLEPEPELVLTSA